MSLFPGLEASEILSVVSQLTIHDLESSSEHRYPAKNQQLYTKFITHFATASPKRPRHFPFRPGTTCRSPQKDDARSRSRTFPVLQDAWHSLCLIDFSCQILWTNRQNSVTSVARGFRELTQVLPRTHLLTAPRRSPRRSTLQQQEAVRSTPGFPILSDICLLGLKGEKDHVSEKRLRGRREPMENGRVR
jgi:hypothetical protein